MNEPWNEETVYLPIPRNLVEQAAELAAGDDPALACRLHRYAEPAPEYEIDAPEGYQPASLDQTDMIGAEMLRTRVAARSTASPDGSPGRGRPPSRWTGSLETTDRYATGLRDLTLNYGRVYSPSRPPGQRRTIPAAPTPSYLRPDGLEEVPVSPSAPTARPAPAPPAPARCSLCDSAPAFQCRVVHVLVPRRVPAPGTLLLAPASHTSPLTALSSHDRDNLLRWQQAVRRMHQQDRMATLFVEVALESTHCVSWAVPVALENARENIFPSILGSLGSVLPADTARVAFWAGRRGPGSVVPVACPNYVSLSFGGMSGMVSTLSPGQNIKIRDVWAALTPLLGSSTSWRTQNVEAVVERFTPFDWVSNSE